jgi:hypothetical protein
MHRVAILQSTRADTFAHSGEHVIELEVGDGWPGSLGNGKREKAVSNANEASSCASACVVVWCSVPTSAYLPTCLPACLPACLPDHLPI